MGCRTQSLQEDYSVFKAEGWKYKQNKTENVKMQRTVMKQEKEVWSHPQHALHLVGLRHTRDTEAQSRVSSRSRDGNFQPNTHQHLKWPKILQLKI